MCLWSQYGNRRSHGHSLIATRALRKGRFFVCSSKGCPASPAPHPTAPNRHVTGALLCKISRYISKQKSLYRRLQGSYSKACKMQLQITCRDTAQSKTQAAGSYSIYAPCTWLYFNSGQVFPSVCSSPYPMPGGRFLHPPGFCNSVNYRTAKFSIIFP